MPRLSSTVLAVGALLSAALADGESDHSQLSVVVPAPLKTLFADGVRHSQALFGSPSYGGDKKIVGQLIYATPKLGETACDAYAIEPAGKVDRPIFLVDRGACDFVQKMRIAQAKGAVAVIIADNVCQCDAMDGYTVNQASGKTAELLTQCMSLAKSSPSLLPGETCENGLPFMADDGTGADIKIPSFLIDFMDAQPIKDCLLSASGSSASLLTGAAFKCAPNTNVIVSLTWDMPVIGDEVSFQLWSSSDSVAVFKRAFADTAIKLKDFTIFQPRYFVWDGAMWGCTIDNLCSTQCTDGGVYCNPDPDHNLFSGVAGIDVVNENLRELCVWQKALETYDTAGGALWWQYVKTFAETCHPGSNPDETLFNEACSQKVHAMIPGLKWEDTSACVKKSWSDATAKGHNVLLDKELQDRKDLKILTLPTAVVNGDVIRGGVTSQVVLMAICAGFSADTKPVLCACVDRSSSMNVLDCLQSACAAGEQLCTTDKKCYPTATYSKQCLCGPDEAWCASTSSCQKAAVHCPSCPDATHPVYCPLTGQCLTSVYLCVPEPQPTSAPVQGTSTGTVLAIVFVAVGLAGSVALVAWRRQRARLHEDVRAILSSYMPLEELDARGGVSAQAPPARRAREAGGEAAEAGGLRDSRVHDESSQFI